VLKEVDDGINELKSQWAKMRKSHARLSKTVSQPLTKVSTALACCHYRSNARTTLATVYRHAQKRRAG